MRTVIVRLAEPEQTGGGLRGLVEVLGQEPVTFSGAAELLDLIVGAAETPVGTQDGFADFDDPGPDDPGRHETDPDDARPEPGNAS